jgi:hypothetical protein
VNCPICGYTATRVNNSYWCPNDRIYLGQNLAINETNEPQRPVHEEKLGPKPDGFTKILDKFIWILMGALYVVVIALVAWSFIFGGLGDNSSIFG